MKAIERPGNYRNRQIKIRTILIRAYLSNFENACQLIKADPGRKLPVEAIMPVIAKRGTQIKFTDFLIYQFLQIHYKFSKRPFSNIHMILTIRPDGLNHSIIPGARGPDQNTFSGAKKNPEFLMGTPGRNHVYPFSYSFDY